MNDDADREVAVFTEAMKVPVQERAAFLERVCAGDESLRHKVEKLLNAQARLEDFLEQPATSAIPTPLLRKIATDPSSSPDGGGRGHGKAETRFQPRLRKRKGKNEK